MHTKNSITTKNNVEAMIIFLKKLKEIRNMKKNDEIFILLELLLTLGVNKLVFLIFLNLIRKPAAIIKTKIEVFIKNIDIAINRNDH